MRKLYDCRQNDLMTVDKMTRQNDRRKKTR